MCFQGTCTRLDLLVKSPATLGVFAIEVELGDDPPFTQNQVVVYPHLVNGGLVISTSPRIALLGLPFDTPLPPIPTWLYYVPGPGQVGVFVHFRESRSEEVLCRIGRAVSLRMRNESRQE